MNDAKPVDDPVELLHEAAECDDLHLQVDLILRAIRAADMRQMENVAMQARLSLLETAPRTRYANEMIAAFTWCQGKLEASPEEFAEFEYDIIQEIDHVLVTLVDYHQVSLDQLYQIIDQMEQSYRRLGRSMRPVAEQRYSTALRTGNVAEAAKRLKPWLNTESDEPCAETRAWERIAEFELMALQGEYEKGLELLSRNWRFRNGLSDDAFLWAVSHAMRPLTLLGRVDEARKLQKQALPILYHEPTDALGAGSQIAFLAHIGELEEALDVFDFFLEPGMTAPDPDAHFRIFAASAGLFRALAKRQPTIRVKLPPDISSDSSDEHSTAALFEWFEAAARDVGSQFDERNGNTYFNETLYGYFNY